MTLKECIAALEGIRAAAGYSTYRSAMRSIERRRLEPDVKENREEREKPKLGEKKRLYDQQEALCSICGQYMSSKEPLEIDHVVVDDPNYNGRHNRRLAHKSCNAAKGARDLVTQSKHSGRTIVEQIQ